jgi:predicted P-loop ATPase
MTDDGNDNIEDFDKRRKAKGRGRPPRSPLPLLYPTKGQPLASHANVVTLLEADPQFKGLVRYNQLALVVDVRKPIPRPAGKATIDDGPYPRVLTETDITRLLEYVQHASINVNNRDIILHAVEDIAQRNSYHPFREYLEGLNWDGKPRIDNLLVTYFGVERGTRDEYHRLAGRFFLMGIAKRGFEPGCQNDYMLVLMGKQGRLKTKALEILGGPFFGGDPPGIHTKDFQQYITGKMLVELAELDALRKADNSFIKRFLTTKADDYRPPYARLFRKVPRSCSFAATTNEDDWSSDHTGARREWPVVVGIINLDLLRADHDQLYAEAAALVLKGERYWPTYEEEKLMFEPEQEARYAESEWMPVIAQWIADKEPKVIKYEYDKNGKRREIPPGWDKAEPPGFTGLEVAKGCMGIKDAKDFPPAIQKEVRKCLKRLDCTQPPRQNARRYWLPPEGGIDKPKGGTGKPADTKAAEVAKPNGQSYADEDRDDVPF